MLNSTKPGGWQSLERHHPSNNLDCRHWRVRRFVGASWRLWVYVLLDYWCLSGNGPLTHLAHRGQIPRCRTCFGPCPFGNFGFPPRPNCLYSLSVRRGRCRRAPNDYLLSGLLAHRLACRLAYRQTSVSGSILGDFGVVSVRPLCSAHRDMDCRVDAAALVEKALCFKSKLRRMAKAGPKRHCTEIGPKRGWSRFSRSHILPLSALTCF
jgi:hypothetical protein